MKRIRIFMKPLKSRFSTCTPPRSPSRSRSLAWVTSSVLLACGLHSSAVAADGPAPSSQERRVVSGVHADAISVFSENGGLVLGTKADVDGGLGVRLNPVLIAYNVEESRKTTVPNLPSYAFLGTTGGEVWIAPEANPNEPVLWPGFSTEDVPNGAADGNQLTLRLESVTGPGTLHIYQTGAFGEPVRRFSSTGTDFREWTLANGNHAHANWAFSAAGAYTLTFSASALTNGVSLSTTQSYAFVVGNVPAPVATTVTLTATTNSSVQGGAVGLQSTVTPANAVGWVEFRDGSTVLGHDVVNAGSAALITTNLALGVRSVTARFVPQWLNDFTVSTSEPVTLSVTDPSGVPFAVTGIATSYLPGDTLQARIAGATLAEGQEIEWRIRPVGTPHAGTIIGRFVPEANTPDARAGRLDLRMDASYDGYELQAALMQDGQAMGTTTWAGPILVSDAVEPLSLSYVGPIPFRLGDTATLVATGRELAVGESLRVVLNPSFGHFSLWNPAGFPSINDRTFAFELPGNGNYPLALQVVRDGLVVAQSAPLMVDFSPHEFFFQGMQPVYRAGQTLRATMTVAPDLGERVTYSWAMYDDYENPMKIAQGEAGRTFEMPVTADMNGKRMFIQANVAYASGNMALVGGAYPYLTVTTNSAQLFMFSSLPDHYHQGSPVNLQLAADPALVEGDSVAWEWRWPGMGWEPLPQAAGLSHRLTAEQAMEGLEVRAKLTFAGSGGDPMIAGPVMVHVDDHGFPAVQQPTITGEVSVTEGEAVGLARGLPTNAATVLTTHRWERKAAGSPVFSPIDGETNALLSFAATLADDGAEYRVSILKPNGTVAYGPSPSVVLSVRAKDLSLAIANGEATLMLSTQNGVVYQLETAPAITGPWNDIGTPIQGTGQAVPVIVPLVGPAGFFQWRVVENP